jgi:hypothetical protein
MMAATAAAKPSAADSTAPFTAPVVGMCCFSGETEGVFRACIAHFHAAVSSMTMRRVLGLIQ